MSRKDRRARERAVEPMSAPPSLPLTPKEMSGGPAAPAPNKATSSGMLSAWSRSYNAAGELVSTDA